MSSSSLVAPIRCLVPALLVCSLLVLTQPSVCAERTLHKRSFLELGCRGNFEQSYLARLERVCEECYQLYQNPKAYNMCRYATEFLWMTYPQPNLGVTYSDSESDRHNEVNMNSSSQIDTAGLK
ncbi:hypothetical protein MTO96_043926 [Rhipicephalus appendiculatus]